LNAFKGFGNQLVYHCLKQRLLFFKRNRFSFPKEENAFKRHFLPFEKKKHQKIEVLLPAFLFKKSCGRASQPFCEKGWRKTVKVSLPAFFRKESCGRVA